MHQPFSNPNRCSANCTTDILLQPRFLIRLFTSYIYPVTSRQKTHHQPTSKLNQNSTQILENPFRYSSNLELDYSQIEENVFILFAGSYRDFLEFNDRSYLSSGILFFSRWLRIVLLLFFSLQCCRLRCARH